jgi:DNA-binding NarL/FixJ family response regulator
VRSRRPDVAIIDIRMPPDFRDEGLRAAAEIRAEHPETAILILAHTWSRITPAGSWRVARAASATCRRSAFGTAPECSSAA